MRLTIIVKTVLGTALIATSSLKATEPRDPAAALKEVTPSISGGGINEPKALANRTAIYHCIRYTIDPQKVADFEIYARRWMEGGIIKRCGGEPLGYFLPKKGYGGADNLAMTLIGFESLAAYEEYRKKLVADPEAKENVEFARKSGCILTEDRSYFYRVGDEGK